jgi:hypothetical protein
MAAPHNPTPATTPMVNRSKIVINVQLLHSRSRTHSQNPSRPSATPPLLVAHVEHDARRTAPFPNGDV